ncbi:MAG: PaaI family thioesterase [Candidatus Lernaella stagnicola]|nr:PaaI family thioesterase [Candidatus Lernaella stagnicola]
MPVDIQTRCAELIELFDHAPIKHHFGMIFSYDEHGNAIFDLPYNPHLNHAFGDVHGGALATIFDNAGWFTVATRYDMWVATADLHMRLLDQVHRADLRATGRLVRAGKKLAVAEMEIRSADDRLIAVGTGGFAVTNQPFDIENVRRRWAQPSDT